VGVRVTQEMIDDAERLATAHFGGIPGTFNKEGWEHILKAHGGKLPIRIKAVPEGMVVPINNVLMTVEATDPKCAWLVNFVETLLSRVWYSCTVATKSMEARKIIERYWAATCDAGSTDFGVNFCLHDFGSRGASSYESAGIGGLAHLSNFLGTDTVHAMAFARDYYGADITKLAFSVPATEHSVMTSEGKDGEEGIVARLLETYPKGILSIVIDSYDDNNFTTVIASKFKDQILARDGKVVFRPDSGDPVKTTLKILRNLGDVFGYTVNGKGMKVLNPKVGMLWGDGIDLEDIEAILRAMYLDEWAASNIVFGMGGGLLQKVNRDTMRFAFKSSAVRRSGVWHAVYKDPVGAKADSGMFKGSKRGHLTLIKDPETGEFVTMQMGATVQGCEDILQTVFENGKIIKTYSWDEVLANGKL